MKQFFLFFIVCVLDVVNGQQSSEKIMMIRPANFGFNSQTAQSNSFQNIPTESDSLLQKKALEEFDKSVEILTQKGVDVIVIEDTKFPIKPDAIFPNNWISFNPDGQIFIYPMYSPNRRIEKRLDIIDSFYKKYHIKQVVNWSEFENENKYLEGTGSIVFDHIHQKIFACISDKTHKDLVNLLASKLHYKTIIFNAVDNKKKPIYHTNVMMSVGTRFAVICSESIKDIKQRNMVLHHLQSNNKTIIHISLQQMSNFVGNLLEVKTKQGKTIIVLSQRALESLTFQQKLLLSTFGELTSISIPTIENVGGGSARCMLTQILLP